MDESDDSMRLDKWLWCARFFKTRAMAATAIKGNKIKVNGNAIKAAKSIRIGDKVMIRKPPYQHDITILELSKNRLSASGASLLYEETPESIQSREDLTKQIKAENASFPRTRGRPSKRDRRHIIRFTRKTSEDMDED